MEEFDKRVLEHASYRPSLNKRYMADTFLIWPDGHDALDECVFFLNGLHKNITFTVEIENNGHLS